MSENHLNSSNSAVAVLFEWNFTTRNFRGYNEKTPVFRWNFISRDCLSVYSGFRIFDCSEEDFPSLIKNISIRSFSRRMHIRTLFFDKFCNVSRIQRENFHCVRITYFSQNIFVCVSNIDLMCVNVYETDIPQMCCIFWCLLLAHCQIILTGSADRI